MPPPLESSLEDLSHPFLGSAWAHSLQELPENIQELAISMHVVPANPKAYPHARLTEASLLLRLIPVRVITHFPRVFISGHCYRPRACLGLITLSLVAFHRHLKRAGPFLAKVLSTMLLRDRILCPERWGGYEFVVCDGTTLCRPGALGSSAVVLFALRLPDLAYVDLVIDPELTAGATFRYYNIRPGQLWLADRGLCNPPGIAFVVDRVGDVLLRFNRHSLPLYLLPDFDLPFDVYSNVTALKEDGGMCSFSLWVCPQQHDPILGRLVVLRLPPDKAQKARDHLCKSHDGPVTPEDLELAGYFMTFTTANADRLSTDAVIDLYPLRWQVELQNRRNKSLGGLDRLPDFLAMTIYRRRFIPGFSATYWLSFYCRSSQCLFLRHLRRHLRCHLRRHLRCQDNSLVKRLFRKTARRPKDGQCRATRCHPSLFLLSTPGMSPACCGFYSPTLYSPWRAWTFPPFSSDSVRIFTGIPIEILTITMQMPLSCKCH